MLTDVHFTCQQHTWLAPRTSGRTPCPVKRPLRWNGISSRPSLCTSHDASGSPDEMRVLKLPFTSRVSFRPRRICGKLEPMASHLPLPSSTNGDHAEGSGAIKELLRPSSPCSPDMGSPASGPITSQVAPRSSVLVATCNNICNPWVAIHRRRKKHSFSAPCSC